MQRVNVQPRGIESYTESAGPEAVAELRRLAEPLAGKRVLHVNATPVGGGVAEILQSAVPLLCDLGLDVEWRTIEAEPVFFEVTKMMHNALQGAPHPFSEGQQTIYRETQRRNAEGLHKHYDVIVVHDPQPAGLLQAAGRNDARWIWRLHIDSSRPHPPTWAFLHQFLDDYDALVFTMAEFAVKDLPQDRVRISAPAIDPLLPKNRPIPLAEALTRLDSIGLDPGRPLVTQVARLDPWKDPNGVIDAYRAVREHVPGLQLALLGVIAAQDDPEAYRIAGEVRAHAAHDPEIHIYVDPAEIGQLEVGAVQQMAAVVFNKSLKEGFGLSVTEALWKATPVIGGRVGGIPLQLQDHVGGFLVGSVEEAAQRAQWLLENPPAAREIAARGRARIREQFLITRLLADELKLYGEVLGLTR